MKMEEKMRKTSSMSNFFDLEVNTIIDFTTNVNLGKMGGGGGNRIKLETRIFVTIILWGILPNPILVFLVLLLLSFWW
jgi:hypothetical protein